MASTMTLPEFLETDCAKLPKDRPKGDDFPKYLKSIFHDFTEGLKDITGNDRLTADIRGNFLTVQNIARDVVEVVCKYYDGSPSRAFAQLSEILEKQKDIFNRLVTRPLETQFSSNLYRLRTEKKYADGFTPKEMFHIPFEDRHKVEAQRYSIPSFPCLYLGSSAYICWEELHRPQLDTVYSVRLKVKPQINVLDFGFTPQMLAWYARFEIKRSIEKKAPLNFGFLRSQVILWPLVAAASVRRLHRKAPFNPEYIVPQLILQFVKEHSKDIHGIRYFSAHYIPPHKKPLSDDDRPISEAAIPLLGCNLVFPVESSAVSGHCGDLLQKFDMTSVLSWQIANHVDLPQKNDDVPNEDIELVRDYPCRYIDTFFGKIESMSLAMRAEPIT